MNPQSLCQQPRSLIKVKVNLQRTVGGNLRRYRQAHRWSQEAFAEQLDYHRTYVGGLERGERNLTLNAVERIAERLELEPLTLLQEPE